MQKSPVIALSIAVACLIVLASFTNVIGVQTIKSSNYTSVKDEIDQKELLFQLILDLANNKEIQKIIQNSEMKGGLERSLQVPGVKLLLINLRMHFRVLLPPPILTKKYLEYAYNMGVRLSKTLDESKIHSILKRFQVNSQGMHKEIAAVIEKNSELNKKIEQLSDAQCDCEKNTTRFWHFPVLCAILVVILWFLIGIIVNKPFSPFIIALYTILQVLIIFCV